MTPIDEILAEFIAGLCKLPEYEGKWELSLIGRDIVLIDQERMFNDKYGVVPPIIRSLIEEEMERRGYDYKHHSNGGHSYLFLHDPKYIDEWDYSDKVHEGEDDKSKTRAVALAAYNALGGKV